MRTGTLVLFEPRCQLSFAESEKPAESHDGQRVAASAVRLPIDPLAVHTPAVAQFVKSDQLLVHWSSPALTGASSLSND